MSETVVRIGPVLMVAIGLLAVTAMVVAYAGRTRLQWAVARASVRATVQLGVLALILGFLVRNLWASAGFVLLMAIIAAWTAAGRVTGHRPTLREIWRTLLPVAAMTIVVVGVLVLVGVLPASGLAVIPSAGIMIGGAMNTTSLTGRRAADELKARHGEVEAALSLGSPIRRADGDLPHRGGHRAGAGHRPDPNRRAGDDSWGRSSAWCSAARPRPMPRSCNCSY